jgi:hypothetical protein
MSPFLFIAQADTKLKSILSLNFCTASSCCCLAISCVYFSSNKSMTTIDDDDIIDAGFTDKAPKKLGRKKLNLY